MLANISLALASKISLILDALQTSSSSKFITFLPPSQKLEFNYSELVFFNVEDANVNKIDANTVELNRSNFAEIVNRIPEDSVSFSPLDSGYLWDVFESIVKGNSIIARIELSLEEEKTLKLAHDFCLDNFGTYKSYKITLDQCILDYEEAKCSAEYATGPEREKLQKNWHDYQEQMLAERIANAKKDLLILGKQSEINAHLTIIDNLEARKAISLLKDQLVTKLQLYAKGVPYRAGTQYLYTDFSPLGTFDKESPAWSSITLYSSEIQTLCAKASAQLKSMFDHVALTENISSISFEYAIVSIVREWFSEAYLTSKNWNFALPGSTLVSNGQNPSIGQIPAFINKIICVRKLSYKQQKVTIKNSSIATPIINSQLIQNFNLDFKSLDRHSWIKLQNKYVKTDVHAPIVDHGAEDNSAMPERKITDLKLLNWRKKNIAQFNLAKPRLVQPRETSSTVDLKFGGVKFIAFECKRLPLSPNPDTTLIWD